MSYDTSSVEAALEKVQADIKDLHEQLARLAEQWIPVEERLPEDGIRVLVHNAFGDEYFIAYYDSAFSCWREIENECRLDNISHWKELLPPDMKVKNDLP